MVTLTLIQGVLNTFVFFLSRVVGYVVDKRGVPHRARPGMGFFVTVIVCQIVFGILASIDRRLVLAPARVPRRPRLGQPARLAAADDRARSRASAACRRGGLPQTPSRRSASRASPAWRSSSPRHPPIEARIAALQASA